MESRFVSQDVQVEMGGETVRMPVSFRWEGQMHTIAEVLDTWADYGFGKTPRTSVRWWQRRHRNYYRVRTSEGRVFELYYDRGANLKHPERRRWYLYREL